MEGEGSCGRGYGDLCSVQRLSVPGSADGGGIDFLRPASLDRRREQMGVAYDLGAESRTLRQGDGRHTEMAKAAAEREKWEDPLAIRPKFRYNTTCMKILPGCALTIYKESVICFEI